MRDAIVVLGMHRSGTSAVAGVLTMLGGTTPKHMLGADDANRKGYFESAPLVQFHDELLTSAGSCWDDWRRFNPAWYRSAVGESFKERAKELFAAEFNQATLPVFKDPRICRFASFWIRILKELNATPRIVIPVRSPLEVANSLKKRDGISITYGLLIWLRHVLDAEFQSRGETRSIFSWKQFYSDWKLIAKKISNDTGVTWPRLTDRSARNIDGFISKELIRNQIEDTELDAHPDVHEWASSAYEALLELTRNPLSNSALDTLDQVRGRFDQSSAIFGRVILDSEIDLEQSRAHATTLNQELDRTNEQLRVLELSSAELSRLTEERDRLSITLQSRNLEMEEAKGQLADLSMSLKQAQQQAIEAGQNRSELLKTLEARNLELSNRISERDQLSATVLSRNLELEEVKGLLADLSTNLERVQQQAIEADQNRSELLKTLEASNLELSKRTSERDQLSAKMQSLDLVLTERTISLERAEKRAIDAVRHRSELSKSLEVYNADLIAAEREKNNLATVLRSRNRELEEVIAAYNRAVETEASYARMLTETKARHESNIRDLRAKLVDAEAAAARWTAAYENRSRWSAIVFDKIQLRRMEQELNRSGLFDADWYKAEYKDATTGGRTPAKHFLEIGFCRGYRPNPYFDTRWYLESYEDVRRSGVNPVLHYARHGFREGRDPGPKFQTSYYLSANPDVRAAGINPLAHYLRSGRAEGRLPVKPAAADDGAP